MSEPALHLVRDPHLDQLGSLKQQRDRLRSEISNLSAARDRLNQATAAETEAHAAIGELGRAEVAAMSEWASAGCVGDPPQIDSRRRQALTQQLVTVQAQAEAIRGAATDLERRMADAHGELADIDRKLAATADVLIAQRYRDELADLVGLATETQSRSARVFAGIQFLIERAQGLQAAGRLTEAQPLFRLIEQLSGLAKPDFSPTNGGVIAAVPTWSRRHAELLK